MMFWIKQIFSFLIGQYSARLLRRKALLIYLRILQAARRSLLAAFAIYFFVQTMILGFMGAVVVGIWLLPYEFETKLYIMLGTFLALFILPAMGILYLLSERLWYKASGAEKLMED